MPEEEVTPSPGQGTEAATSEAADLEQQIAAMYSGAAAEAAEQPGPREAMVGAGMPQMPPNGGGAAVPPAAPQLGMV